MTAILNLEREMEREEAWALALLLKRLTWDSIRECAQCDEEARIMVIAVERAQTALAERGIKPR